MEQNLPAMIRQLIHFAWSSGCGLVADLGTFALLVHIGASGARANLVSSSVAITLAYLLVTRFSFRATPTWRTYAVFVAWYAASATAVSLMITVISHGEPTPALIAKCCSVPVTFLSNFLFGRWLFAGGAERLLRRSVGPVPCQVTRVLSIARRHSVWLLSSAVALWYVLLVVPISERATFYNPPGLGADLRRRALEALCVIALTAITRYAIRFAQHVAGGNARHRRWLAISSGILGLNVGVLLLVYPGFWVWDEFGVLTSVRSFSTDAWQGYLTNVYYSLSMMLIPSGMGIVVVQLLFAAVVSGYLISALHERLTHPRLALLCLAPLVALPTVLNNTYPLRLTPYAYLLALALGRLLIVGTSRDPGRATASGLIGFGVGIAVLAFWRTEGLLLLVLLPVYFVVAGYVPLIRRAPRTVIPAAVAVVVAVLASGAVTLSTMDPRYQTTAYINPLSTMVQHPLAAPDRDADLAAVDRVVPVAALRKWPSYTESPAFWAGLRPGFEAHLVAFRSAYADLVVHDPILFLQNRWSALLAANSMQQDYLPQVLGAGIFSADPAPHDALENFGNSNALGRPIDAPLRAAVVSALLLTDGPHSTPAAAIVWNALPTVAAVLILLGWSIIRRRWLWALCAAALIAQTGLVFLTEPAALFMYFLPVYLAGGVLVAGALAGALDRGLTRHAARALRPLEGTADLASLESELLDA